MTKENSKRVTPRIIDEINEYLHRIPSEDKTEYTVEEIAQTLGINSRILYEWVTSDSEFSETLERLKDVQQNDPFRDGTSMDTRVNAMMIAIVLMETRDRHYKAQNQ